MISATTRARRILCRDRPAVAPREPSCRQNTNPLVICSDLDLREPANREPANRDQLLVLYGVSIDPSARTVSFTQGSEKSGTLAYEQPSPDVLVLNGSLDGRKVQMQGRLIDRRDFLLVNRGFHWVQEYTFNW